MARIGLIGGTGLDDWGGEAESISRETPFGPPSDAISLHQVSDHEILFLPRHGTDHSIPPHLVNYRANLYALQGLGVQIVISVNAVGSMNPRLPPAALVIPDQVIDYTWGREQTYSDGTRPLAHVEFGHPFSAGLSWQLRAAGRAIGLTVAKGGCVGVTQGPRLETEAEVRRLVRDGCDLVGMTSMPEAGLARELGLSYASLCVVANWAAGVGHTPVRISEIEATLESAMGQARRLLHSFFDLF
jgi:5'-deoxy-5'-methylthioadenosine phosphorylase